MRWRYHMTIFGIALVLLVTNSHGALAWGDLGHKVICEIALQRVAPATRAAIDKLMKEDTKYSSFAEACTWPDHPRKRTEEHFPNLPRDAHGLTTDDCAGATACVVTAIRNDVAVLVSKTAPSADKLSSLKYLGHWVGDIHQPLHVSFRDDRGGNNIQVSGTCSGNLHAAWDSCLVIEAVGQDAARAATELEKAISPSQTNQWLQSDAREWANESFAITERLSTGYCHMEYASCAPGPTKLRIDREYIAANAPIVRAQLQKAGVRLAHALDQALAAEAK